MLKGKRGIWLYLAFALTLVLQGSSQTGTPVAGIPCVNNLTTINFDDLPDASPFLGNEYASAGVTFSGHYFATGNPYAMSSGLDYWIPDGTIRLDSYCNAAGYIQANFASPVNFAAVDITPFEGAPGEAVYSLGLALYDILGNQLAETTFKGMPDVTYHLEAQCAGAAAAYARFYGYYGDVGAGGVNAVSFDNAAFGIRMGRSIDFDDRPDGSDLVGDEYAAQGVIFSGHYRTSGDPYPMAVGIQGPPGTLMLNSYCNAAGYIQADFSIPVSFVSVYITTFENTSQTYSVGLQLFDAGGNLLAEKAVSGPCCMTYQLSAQSGGPNVAYARFYGYYGDVQNGDAYGVNAAYADNFTFGNCGYNFTGFKCVENKPVVNKARAATAILIKWRLTDPNGAPVSDRGSFVGLTSYAATCGTMAGDPFQAVEENTSGLLYLGAGWWQIKWKTPKAYERQCRVMVLTLADASRHEAYFWFKQ